MSQASGDGYTAIRQDSYGVAPAKLRHGLGQKPLAYSPVEELRRVQAAAAYVVAAQQDGCARFGARIRVVTVHQHRNVAPAGALRPARGGPGPGAGYVQLSTGEWREQARLSSRDNHVSVREKGRSVSPARGQQVGRLRPCIKDRVEHLDGVERNRSTTSDHDDPAVREKRCGVSAPGLKHRHAGSPDAHRPVIPTKAGIECLRRVVGGAAVPSSNDHDATVRQKSRGLLTARSGHRRGLRPRVGGRIVDLHGRDRITSLLASSHEYPAVGQQRRGVGSPGDGQVGAPGPGSGSRVVKLRRRSGNELVGAAYDKYATVKQQRRGVVYARDRERRGVCPGLGARIIEFGRSRDAADPTAAGYEHSAV